MSFTTHPLLPLPGDAFGTDVVVAAAWQTEQPDEQGTHTATLLTLRPGRGYHVVEVGADWDTDVWRTDDDYGYASLATAVEHFTHREDGTW